MRLVTRPVGRLGLGLWIALAIGCTEKAGPPTREECAKVAEHIADLIITDAKAHPDAFWDGLHADASTDPGIPPAVTKSTFKAWIDGADGQTWMLQRRGQVLAATQQGVDSCTKNATRAQVKCLLAASSKTEVDTCDKARAPAPPSAAEGSGSGGPDVGSAGSAEGSAAGSAEGSGSAAP